MSTQADFDTAIIESRKLKVLPAKSELLKLYGLFKQGSGEDFSKVEEPTAILAFEAKAKYAAWKEVKDLAPEDAQKQYIELVNELKEKYGVKEEAKKE